MSEDITLKRVAVELALEAARLRSLVADVATSGVVFDDPRVGYVEVQIDRATWKLVQAGAFGIDGGPGRE